MNELTMGDLGTIMMRNNSGFVVAKLYIMPDGSLHEDSWICPKGWMGESEVTEDE